MAGIEALTKLASSLDGEEDIVTLQIPEAGVTISHWKSYEFANDFMDASSSFTFEVADDNFQELSRKVQNGQKVALFINGSIQATGYVDQIQVSYSSSGTSMRISGRDALSPAADSCIDPKYLSTTGTTIGGIIRELFKPYGFTDVRIDDRLNLRKLTNTVKVFTTDENHQVIERLLDIKLNSKTKPKHGEGIYEFCQRLGRRYGFHIWCSADGKTIFAGKPNFDSEPIGKLIHSTSSPDANNVLSASVQYDWASQPSVIIAEGHGGGGTFRKAGMKVMLVNELLSDTDDSVKAIVDLKKRYPEALLIPRREEIKRPTQVVPVVSGAFAKTVFLYDDQSHDKTQLKNYVIHRMAEFQSRFLTATYTVNRHSYNRSIWAPNTIADVKDEALGINGLMWVKARRFTKDRSGGTKTELKLILPNTLQLSEDTRG